MAHGMMVLERLKQGEIDLMVSVPIQNSNVLFFFSLSEYSQLIVIEQRIVYLLMKKDFSEKIKKY